MSNILILFLIVICIDVSWSFQILSHLIRTQSNLSLSSSIKDDDINLSPSYQVNFDYEGRLRTLDPRYRCGFISLIGAANMGKSSLLNALLQETLCTTTHRPQTTRHAILGVLTSEPNKCQLCFYDTPGVIEDPAYKLQEGMMEAVKGAFRVSDVVLVVTDLFSTPIPDDELFNKLQLSNVKKIVCINKVDLVDKVGSVLNQQYHDDSNDEDSRQYKRTITVADAILNWRELVPDAVAIIPISTAAGSTDVGVTALRTLLLGGPDVPKSFRDLGRPLDGMFLPGISSISDEEASKLIPISPPLYAPETLTDKSERFFTSEIIRAALFTNLGKELPYCCEVRIEDFKDPQPGDKREVTKIKAVICVERDSQKGIVVGKGGSKIKDVGVQARKQLEDFLQCSVHLDLNVRVEKDWRRDEKKLKEFGYL